MKDGEQYGLILHEFTRSVRTAVSGASHLLPKLSSLRAEDEHGRWYKNPRLVNY